MQEFTVVKQSDLSQGLTVLKFATYRTLENMDSTVRMDAHSALSSLTKRGPPSGQPANLNAAALLRSSSRFFSDLPSSWLPPSSSLSCRRRELQGQCIYTSGSHDLRLSYVPWKADEEYLWSSLNPTKTSQSRSLETNREELLCWCRAGLCCPICWIQRMLW